MVKTHLMGICLHLFFFKEKKKQMTRSLTPTFSILPFDPRLGQRSPSFVKCPPPLSKVTGDFFIAFITI